MRKLQTAPPDTRKLILNMRAGEGGKTLAGGQEPIWGGGGYLRLGEEEKKCLEEEGGGD